MNDILIVGNGTSILKKKRGKRIDESFKEIVRLNDYVIDDYEDFVGSKTTIWSTGAGIATTPRNVENYKNVWISNPSCCQNMMNDLAERVTCNGQFELMGYKFLSNFEKEVKMPRHIYCTSGLYAIGYALTKYKKVHIMGFDLFSDCIFTKNVNHYYGEHKTEAVGKDHRPNLEKKYINQMKKIGKIVEI